MQDGLIQLSKAFKGTDIMKVVVIDGQGGRLGQNIVEEIIRQNISCELVAIGTNSIATASMRKGGAVNCATGENPVIVACRDADVIIGPIGILAADSLLGEVTPKMALAVGQSNALKLLLPVSHCKNQIVGVKNVPISDLVKDALSRLLELV